MGALIHAQALVLPDNTHTHTHTLAGWEKLMRRFDFYLEPHDEQSSIGPLHILHLCLSCSDS